MTKADIVDQVFNKVGGASKKETTEIIEAVFQVIKQTLQKPENVKVSGFGNFEVKSKQERIGRNPQSGVPINISSRNVLTFKPSQLLKKTINPKI